MMPGDISTNIDVRMRGFSDRALVSEAIQWIDQRATALATEDIDVSAAFARILATDVTAAIDVPSFRRSAMDGFALQGAATTGAGDYNVLNFRVIGESLPGRGFDGQVGPAEAVRIMTGAPVPVGADAVIPAEFTAERDGEVGVTTATPPGKHVALPGEDIGSGSQVARAGRCLRPQDLGVLASVGLSNVSVVRRPRVRVLVTGNELVPAGGERSQHQIHDANSSMLRALIDRDGGVLERCEQLPDDPDQIRESMDADGADVVLVAGGSSVGVEDHAPAILAAQGELAIHGIALRPASPTGMGRIKKSLVFLLPGNPVSCLCAYDFFAGRAIRLLGGRLPTWPYPAQTMTVRRKIVSAIGRVDYVRVRIIDGQVEPIAVSGASILSTTTRAEGFVVIPETSEGVGPGAEVTVSRYDLIG